MAKENTQQLKKDPPSFLYVQTADSGSLVIKEKTDKLSLTLSGVPSSIISFSDHPNRIVKTLPFDIFARFFEKIFKDDPPNAALTIPKVGVRILELLSVSFDVETRTAIYDARIIPPEQASAGLSYIRHAASGTIDNFASPSLVIDDSVSHGWHYAPDVGDKLGDGATFLVDSPSSTGYIGFENVSDKDVRITSSDTVQGSTFHFTMQPGASICATFEGAASFDIAGHGYIEIKKDDSVAGSIPSECKNYLNLSSTSDTPISTGANILKGIIDIVKALGDEG